MSTHAPRSRPPEARTGGVDARATRRASLAIGWQIMVASAVLVLGIIVVVVVFVVHQGQPREQIDRDPHGVSHVFVDTGDVFQALIVIGAGAVVFAGLVSWFIARRAVKPLGHALQLQREFVADASHELRTPLSVLDARIQVLERRLTGSNPPSTAEAARTVAELRSDSRALVDIVGDLLLAAGGDSTRADPVVAGPIVVEAADSLRILADERGVRVSVDVDDVARVRIPAAGLRRCVIALVDNAIAHSPDGSTVTVDATAVAGRLRLEVADQGPGIQGISPERVFDRFAHSAPVRESQTVQTVARPSFGIGLALVREIATRHGGEVHVQQTSASGTIMVLDLPLVR